MSTPTAPCDYDIRKGKESWLVQLSPLLFPAGCTRRLIAMFAVYFDESGTHGGSSVFTVAGYIATVEQWVHFEREWCLFLCDFEVPEGEAFHMADLHAKNDRIFGAWSQTKKRNAINRALGIVKRRVQFGVSCSVSKADYEELIFNPIRRAGFNSLDGAHTTYSFCLADCLKQIGHWADTYNHTDPIAYFFESGAGVGNDINGMMANISGDPALKQRFRYSTWSFKDKATTPQLQAADINAYESYKHWVNLLHCEKSIPTRYTFNSLMEIPQLGQYLGRAEITKLITETCQFVPGGSVPPAGRWAIFKI